MKCCIKCNQPLDSNLNGDFSSYTIYCINKDCERYGLVTVIYLEDAKKEDSK